MLKMIIATVLLSLSTKTEKNISNFHNDYINMNNVIDFEATETGLMIYTSSGDMYYWER